MKGAFINLKKMREMFWSGRRDLNSGPPAPKSGVLPLGSPSFSISVLKTNELEKYLVVARCTEMCLRMYGVPRIFPIAKRRRMAVISQTSFALSYADLSAMCSIRPNFSHSVHRCR